MHSGELYGRNSATGWNFWGVSRVFAKSRRERKRLKQRASAVENDKLQCLPFFFVGDGFLIGGDMTCRPCSISPYRKLA